MHAGRRSVILAAALGAVAAGAAEFQPSRAVATTVEGGCQVRPADERAFRPALHEVLPLEGSVLVTAKDGRLALALRNGAGLALEGEGRTTVERFGQTGFAADRESLIDEPSVSILRIHLEEGRLALAHPGPSPLSDLRVATAAGEFHFHHGCAVLATDTTGTRVLVLEGAGTFLYPDGGGRELVSAGSALLVTPFSASRGEAAARDEKVPPVPASGALGAAASSASGRVLHRAGPGGAGVGFDLLASNRESGSTER
jgi:hypothetical protein